VNAPPRDERSVPPQRRVGIALVATATTAAATVGYVTDGVAMAVVQGTLFLVGGLLGLRFMPDPAPPPSSSIPRPAVGSSRSAVRRRRDERIASIAVALPLTAGAVLIAFLADDATVRLVAGLTAILCVLAFGAAGLLASAPGPFWDRARIRLYERAVARADERRASWEQRADPAAERIKERRIGAFFLLIFLWPLGFLLALGPALLGAASGSPTLAAVGAIVSVALVAVFLGWSWRSLRAHG
jgi:hypothetical protein